MKKQVLYIFTFCLIAFGSIAQQTVNPNLIPCATYDAMEEAFKKDPNLKAKFNLIQSQLELEYKQEINAKSNKKLSAVPVYTIPVVFHIMGPQVISDQTFIDLLVYINNDYARTGADVNTISPAFSSLYVDAQIRFALAKKDPNGNCTNGIIRHNSDNITWDQTNPAYNYSGVGTNRWPTNKYLNIYIVDCISGPTNPCPPTGSYIGGYTYLPGSAPSTSADAIVMLKSQLAQTNYTDSRTLSHEMGHWLNLSHVFGNNNCTGTSCGDDGVTDTPPTKCHFSTCPASVGGNTCDASGNANVENIMDYSSCTKMFTQGQVTKMRTALTSNTAGRSNLWSTANLLATGITPGYTCTPIADFAANKLINCTGNTFTFTSTSQVGSSGSLLWTFQGGNPSTSTSTSQAVTYSTAGTYSVSLTASNPNGTNTMNKTSYISAVNGSNGILAPTMYDFETTSFPNTLSIINNNLGTVTWSQNSVNGANSTSKSIYLNNAASSNIGGQIDVFETPVYNFANTTGISLSYYYAYAKKAVDQLDTFKIQYSLDCGGSWSNVLGVTATAQMASTSGGTLSSAFNPTPTQWVNKTILPVLMTTLNNKPSVKFRFYFRVDPAKTTANNMYIDQINITGNVISGITELEKSMNLFIYPNPTLSSSTIDFRMNINEFAKISVVDLMGRTVEANVVHPDADGNVSHKVNITETLAAGVYIINIDINNQRISKKLIIQ